MNSGFIKFNIQTLSPNRIMKEICSSLILGILLLPSFSSNVYAMEEQKDELQKEVVTSKAPPPALSTTIWEVGAMKNPDFFETSWEDLERMGALNTFVCKRPFPFGTYVREGFMGPVGNKEEHGGHMENFKINLAYDEKTNQYIKFFVKYYNFTRSDSLKDRQKKVAKACAEHGSHRMSQILGLRLVPPSHLRCDNIGDLSKAEYVASAQFLVEANVSFRNVTIDGIYNDTRGEIYAGGREKLSNEDRSNADLLRACLGSSDRNYRNMLFHQASDGSIKPIVVDLEDLYKRDPNLIKLMNSNDKFSKKSIALFRTITREQLESAFYAGKELVPEIYNDEWFASLLDWNNEFLDWIEQNGNAVD